MSNSEHASERAGNSSASARRIMTSDRRRYGKKPAWDGISLAIFAAGGLFAGLAASTPFLVAPPQTFEMTQIAPSELDAAAQSLLPRLAGALLTNAKTCKAPLALVVLRGDGTPGGIVRIHSGSYTTSPIRLDLSSVRVALPFPAPYLAGHGQLIIESDDSAFSIFLMPGWSTRYLKGSAVLDVRWNTGSPC